MTSRPALSPDETGGCCAGRAGLLLLWGVDRQHCRLMQSLLLLVVAVAVLYAGSHDKMLRAWWAVDGRLKWALLAGDQVRISRRARRVGSRDRQCHGAAGHVLLCLSRG